MRIGIIGSAGRKDDAAKMNLNIYNLMYSDTSRRLKEQKGTIGHLRIDLVSGGAAWADHLAVDMFLNKYCDSLTLYLPCKWNCETATFEKTQEGEIATYYHKQFSEKIGRDTLQEIALAQDQGAKIVSISGGFKSRNLLVGQVDALIAYTWNNGNIPKAGGTLHTWQNSIAKIKYHQYIGELPKLYHKQSGTSL